MGSRSQIDYKTFIFVIFPAVLYDNKNLKSNKLTCYYKGDFSFKELKLQEILQSDPNNTEIRIEVGLQKGGTFPPLKFPISQNPHL